MAGYASESAYAHDDDVHGRPRRSVSEGGRATHLVLMRDAGRDARSIAGTLGSLRELFSVDGVQQAPMEAREDAVDLIRALGVVPVVASEKGARIASALAGVEEVFPNRLRFLTPPAAISPVFQSAGRSGWRAAADLQGGRRSGYAESPSQASPYVGSAMGWNLPMIGIDPGYGPDGTGVTVAVLDTGIDLTHDDVVHRDPALLDTRCFVAGARVQDGNGHGTHCSGVLVGQDSATGARIGVAPGARLMVGKVLADDGYGFDLDIIQGIGWAFLRGARVISLSLCSNRSVGDPGSDVYERLAARLIAGNSLLVAAAGNESDRPRLHAPVGDPACCPSIISVGAIGAIGEVADFSARKLDHGAVDVVAPGVDITSWAAGGGYRLMSGSSMACPHAAGVAALLFAAWPDATAANVRERLLASALPRGLPEDYGAGIVQAPQGT